MSTSERVLAILSHIAETKEGQRDLHLYDLEILDSLTTVELMVALEEEFGIEISPAEFERDTWATPRQIVADIERRIAA